MNERGHESGNASVTNGRSLPWLQDVDADSNGTSDNWLSSWSYDYRDVVIVDANNYPVDVYNLTDHSLAVAANRDVMRQKLIAAAEATQTVSWTNPSNALDVNDDTYVSPLDVVLVLNELNSVGGHLLEPLSAGQTPPAYLDTSGDGYVSPIDALLVINELNSMASTQVVAAVPATTASSSQTLDPPALPASTSLLAAAIDQVFSDNQADQKRLRLAEDGEQV